MLIGASFALHQEIEACKLRYPKAGDELAFRLSVRPQGCVPHVPPTKRAIH